MKIKNSFRMFKVLSVLSVLSLQTLSPNAFAQSIDEKLNAEAGIDLTSDTNTVQPILGLNQTVTVTSDDTDSEETDVVVDTDTDSEDTDVVVDTDTHSEDTDVVVDTDTDSEDTDVVVDTDTDSEDRDLASDDEIQTDNIEERFGKLDTALESLTESKTTLLAELGESEESKEEKLTKIESHNSNVNIEITLANELNNELAQDHERKEEVLNIITFFEDVLIDLESEEIIALLEDNTNTDETDTVVDTDETDTDDTDTDLAATDLEQENDELHQLVCEQRDQISDLTSQIESMRAEVTPYESMMNSMMQLMAMNQMMMMQSMNQQPLYERAGTPVDTIGTMMAPMMMMQSMAMGMQTAYMGMMAPSMAYGLGQPSTSYNVQGDFYGRDYSMVQNPQAQALAAMTGQTNTLGNPFQFPYTEARFGQIASGGRTEPEARTTASETEESSVERENTEEMVN
jgi:hypothetical protein